MISLYLLIWKFFNNFPFFLLIEAVREAFACFLDTRVSFQDSSFNKALFFGLVGFSYSTT